MLTTDPAVGGPAGFQLLAMLHEPLPLKVQLNVCPFAGIVARATTGAAAQSKTARRRLNDFPRDLMGISPPIVFMICAVASAVAATTSQQRSPAQVQLVPMLQARLS